MFSYISGILADKYEGIAVIDAGGIGYEMLVTSGTISQLPEIGKEAKLYTYFQVREDGVALFGFSSPLEKSMFLKLINVSGVGAKTAIGMLSNIKYTDLAAAIISENIDLLVTVKGIGKKTAERIILELKEKIDPLEFIGKENNNTVFNDAGAVVEAVNTLVSLGINRNEAQKLARSAAKKDSTAEQIIVEVFKTLGR